MGEGTGVPRWAVGYILRTIPSVGQDQRTYSAGCTLRDTRRNRGLRALYVLPKTQPLLIAPTMVPWIGYGGGGIGWPGHIRVKAPRLVLSHADLLNPECSSPS